MARFDLTDEEWAIIAPHLPKQGRGPERKDDRKVLTGFFYILRTGHHGCDLLDRYDPRTTVYNRYNRWGERGVWRGIFEALQRAALKLDHRTRQIHAFYDAFLLQIKCGAL